VITLPPNVVFLRALLPIARRSSTHKEMTVLVYREGAMGARWPQHPHFSGWGQILHEKGIKTGALWWMLVGDCRGPHFP
jgi:hypothetical protein